MTPTNGWLVVGDLDSFPGLTPNQQLWLWGNGYTRRGVQSGSLDIFVTDKDDPDRFGDFFKGGKMGWAYADARTVQIEAEGTAFFDDDPTVGVPARCTLVLRDGVDMVTFTIRAGNRVMLPMEGEIKINLPGEKSQYVTVFPER